MWCFHKNTNGLIKVTNSAYPGSPPFLATLIQEAQVKFATSLDNLLASLAKLMDIDDSEDAFSNWNSKLQSSAEEYEEATQREIHTLVAIHSPAQNPPPPPPTAQNAQNPTSRHIEDSLKPSTLSLDMTPTELRHWLGKHQAWYSYNDMPGLPISQQHSFFYCVLDADLTSHLQRHIHPHTSIFCGNDDTESCISISQDLFSQQYPLIEYRVQLFHKLKATSSPSQTSSTTFSSWPLEADLHKLDIDDIQCFRALAGAADYKLHQHLLKLSPLTLASIQHEAHEYEMLKVVSKKIPGQPT